MGLRVDPADLEVMRRSGVRSVEFHEDGSVATVEFFPSRDTIPAPAESGVVPIDPHPDLLPDDEPESERIARESEWLEDWEEAFG